MTSLADVYAGLADIFSDAFMRDDIVLTPTLSADDVDGWDSFKQIEIIMAAEEKFDIKFTSKDLDDLPNLGTLAGIIHKKLGGVDA